MLKFNPTTQLVTSYINSTNRTIETLQIGSSKKIILYNHQVQYIKLFDQKVELTNYLNALPYRMFNEFYSEEKMDKYLLSLSI